MSRSDDDLVRPFQIDASALRGRLVRLGTTVDTILTRHAYPEPVAQMLGEAIALAVLLAGALKYDGVFTLQTKGNGPIRLMVADVTSGGAVRGYAQFDQDALDRLAGQPGPVGAVPRLLGAGYLAFTVDQGEHTERYQGIVDLDGASLGDCVHHYFRQSEQIETGVLVAAQRPAIGGWRAGGVMIQRLPPASRDRDGEEVPQRLGFGGELAAEADDDGWRRALLLMSSCTPAELTDAALGADALLFRLFHEDGVRVYPAQPIADRCRCSRERIERVLQSIPRAELADLSHDDGEVSVTCEFCGTRYGFDEAALDLVYAGA